MAAGKKPTCPPDGFVVNTMHWVLYWLLTSETYRDVVIGAANEGNDFDTVGGESQADWLVCPVVLIACQASFVKF